MQTQIETTFMRFWRLLDTRLAELGEPQSCFGDAHLWHSLGFTAREAALIIADERASDDEATRH